jgi:hypothetical protein
MKPRSVNARVADRAATEPPYIEFCSRSHVAAGSLFLPLARFVRRKDSNHGLAQDRRLPRSSRSACHDMRRLRAGSRSRGRTPAEGAFPSQPLSEPRRDRRPGSAVHHLLNRMPACFRRQSFWSRSGAATAQRPATRRAAEVAQGFDLCGERLFQGGDDLERSSVAAQENFNATAVSLFQGFVLELLAAERRFVHQAALGDGEDRHALVVAASGRRVVLAGTCTC